MIFLWRGRRAQRRAQTDRCAYSDAKLLSMNGSKQSKYLLCINSHCGKASKQLPPYNKLANSSDNQPELSRTDDGYDMSPAIPCLEAGELATVCLVQCGGEGDWDLHMFARRSRLTLLNHIDPAMTW